MSKTGKDDLLPPPHWNTKHKKLYQGLKDTLGSFEQIVEKGKFCARYKWLNCYTL